MARASTRASIGFIVGMALGGAALGVMPYSAGLGLLLGQSPVLPSRVASVLSSGADYHRRGDYERAAVFLQQAQAGQDALSSDSKQDLNKYLALNNAALQGRREGAAQLRKAEEAYKNNNIPEAESLLKKVVNNQFLTAADKLKAQQLADQVRPSNTGPKPENNPGGAQTVTLARAKLRQARGLMNKGEFDAADVLAREVLQTKGIAYDMKEDTPAKLIEEIHKSRSDRGILLNMARNALTNGDFDTAENLALKAKAVPPSLLVKSTSLFRDTPEKVLRDIKDARMKLIVNKQPNTAPKTVEAAKPKENKDKDKDKDKEKESPTAIDSIKNLFKSNDTASPDKAEPHKSDTSPQSKQTAGSGTQVAQHTTPAKTVEAAKPKDNKDRDKDKEKDSPATALDSIKNLFKSNDTAATDKAEPHKNDTPPQSKQTANSGIQLVQHTTTAKPDADPFALPGADLIVKPAPDVTPKPASSQPPTSSDKSKPASSQTAAGDKSKPASASADKNKPATTPAPASDKKAEAKAAVKPAVPAKPAAPETAAKTKTPADNAKALLKQARQQIDDGNFTKAKQLVGEATALKAQYNWWDDSPEKVTADIQRAAAKTSVSPAVAKNDKPATSAADHKSVMTADLKPAPAEKKPASTDKKPEITVKDIPAPKTKDEAKVLLTQARERFKSAQYDDAEKIAIWVKEAVPEGWGLFEDSPDKVLLEVRRARVKNEREESIKVLAEARKLYEQGNHDQARALANRADRLHGPYSIWDMGDRPQKLLVEIEVAQVKIPKEKAVTTPYATATPKKDQPPKPTFDDSGEEAAAAVAEGPAYPQIKVEPRRPGQVTTAPVPPRTNAVAAQPPKNTVTAPQMAGRTPTPQVAGRTPAPAPAPAQMAGATPPPSPPTPVQPTPGPGPMVQQVNPADEARLAEARRVLVYARGFLKQGDFVKARSLADQVEIMGVNLNRPGEDSPGAVRRDIQVAQLASQQPDVIPIPVHPATADPAKVWAHKLVEEMQTLQREGKLTEARQKALAALQAQKDGANFEDEEDRPERALLHLAGLATKKIESLMNEAADYIATAAIDPSRYRRAEDDLQQAHQLAVSFALDTQPIDNKLVSLRQTREKMFASTAPGTILPQTPPDSVPPVTLAQPTMPLAATPGQPTMPLAVTNPMQPTTPTRPTMPLAATNPVQPMTPAQPTMPLAATDPVQPTAPLPGALPLPGRAHIDMTAAQHEEPDPHQHGLELLDKARIEIRNGNTVTARRLAEEAYKGEFSVQKDAELVLHSIDAEEFNQRRMLANKSFQAAASALRRGESDRARSMFVNLDYTLLEPELLNRYKEIMRTPQMQPKAVAQAEPLPSTSLSPGGRGAGEGEAGKATASDTPPPARLVAPENDSFAVKVSAMQEIQFQKLREDNLRVQREAVERFRAGDPDRALEILQNYLSDLNDTQIDQSRLAQLRRPVESRLEQFKTMKATSELASVTKGKNNSMGEIMKNRTKADELKHEKVAELMKQYHQLYKEGKYREAEYAAMKAHELDPDNVAADAAINIAQMHRHVMDAKALKKNHEDHVLYDLNQAEDEGPVVNTNDPIHFDKTISERNRNRDKYLRGNEFSTKTEKERDIERRLKTPISFDFKNLPLKQVLEELRDLSGVNVVADTRALQEEGVNLDQPLTEKLEGVALESALRIVLDKVKLTHIIKNDVLMITTASRAKGRLVARTFQVADIVIPVENFAGNSAANVNNVVDRMASNQRSGYQTGVTPYTGSQTLNNGIPTGSPGDSPGALGTGSPGATPPGTTPPGQRAAGMGKPTRQPGQTLEDVLIKLITNTIEPNSWAEMGGPGTIDYFPLGMALVVNQTPDIQEQIAELLQALRRLQDVEVAIEVRFITISESFYERIGLDFNVNVLTDTARFQPEIVTGVFNQQVTAINQFLPNKFVAGITPAGTFTHDLDIPIKATSFGPATPPFGGFPIAPGADGGLSLGLAFLSDIQVFLFMEAAQGDRRTNVMQAPKLTMFNAQTATINVLDTVFFVTGNIIGLFNGQVIYNPQNQPFNIGLSLTLQPVVSADRRFVRISLSPTLTNLTTPLAALFPITTVVTPVFDTGNVGQPVPITQYLQQPAFTTVGVQTTVSVPDGGTVLLGGLKTLREGRNEFGPPVLSKLPWVNRLFKNVGYGRDAESLLLMVTPRIIINEEEEQIQVPGIVRGGGGNP